MTFFSTSLHNSAETNASYYLRAAAYVQPIPSQVEDYVNAKRTGRYAMKPNFEVVGTCGHRLEVLSPYNVTRVKKVEASIAAGKPTKKRCEHCPK